MSCLHDNYRLVMETRNGILIGLRSICDGNSLVCAREIIRAAGSLVKVLNELSRCERLSCNFISRSKLSSRPGTRPANRNVFDTILCSSELEKNFPIFIVFVFFLFFSTKWRRKLSVLCLVNHVRSSISTGKIAQSINWKLPSSLCTKKKTKQKKIIGKFLSNSLEHRMVKTKLERLS